MITCKKKALPVLKMDFWSKTVILSPFERFFAQILPNSTFMIYFVHQNLILIVAFEFNCKIRLNLENQI